MFVKKSWTEDLNNADDLKNVDDLKTEDPLKIRHANMKTTLKRKKTSVCKCFCWLNVPVSF